jgi:hypothetical protein
MVHRYQIEILLALALLLSFFSWGKRVLFPFQIFTTWVHECWHAVVASLLGASDVSITLATDGSGLTRYRIPKSRFAQGLVASAGYLGSSLTGCVIFFLSTQTKEQRLHVSSQTLLLSLCAAIVFSLIFWIRNIFGWVVVAIMGVALASLVYFPSAQPYIQPVMIFIGIQTALNALFDIRVLFSIESSKGVASDAHTLQRLFFLPAWFWALLWLATSLAFMYLTFKLSSGNH